MLTRYGKSSLEKVSSSSSSTSGAGISPPAVLSLPELFWLLDALFSISCLLQLPITSMGSNRLTKTFFIVHVF